MLKWPYECRPKYPTVSLPVFWNWDWNRPMSSEYSGRVSMATVLLSVAHWWPYWSDRSRRRQRGW